MEMEQWRQISPILRLQSSLLRLSSPDPFQLPTLNCLPCSWVPLLTVPSLGPSPWHSTLASLFESRLFPKLASGPCLPLSVLRPSSNSPKAAEELLLCCCFAYSPQHLGNIWLGLSSPWPAGGREGGTLGLLPLRCPFFGLEEVVGG